MYEGSEIGVHSDIISNYNTDRVIENIYSAIIYLNNDYNGGEIFFPNEDISLKLDPGSLVYFHGDSKTTHGVKEIKSGERTNWIFFFKERK
jgi:predicted 2-oxoglutarate/Fe(II)-dependent dioxygenase YbiX